MKKTIKILATKEIKNVKTVKGGEGDDPDTPVLHFSLGTVLDNQR